MIVSDDGSDRRTKKIIDELPFDKRCYSQKNQGLGANSNKGIRAATGDFVLFLQDDWIVARRPSYLLEAVRVMEAFPDIGLLLLRNVGTATETRTIAGSSFKVLGSDEDAFFPIVYSDNPHLKRRDFHDRVGWYCEGVPMTTMERQMAIAVFNQNFYETGSIDGEDPFIHIGDKFSFNPGRTLVIIESIINKIPAGSKLLSYYRGRRQKIRKLLSKEAFKGS